MTRILSPIFIALIFLPETASASEVDLLEYFSEGGVAVVVIISLSILFLSVSIERLVHFREKYIFSHELLDQVRALWGHGEVEKISQLLISNRTSLARVLGFIVDNRRQSFDFISTGAGEIASRELRKHQQKFYALSIVATVAPIVGLLGTVIGMIEAFHVIAFSQGMGNPTLLAGGISKALINTAAGLGVALPALGMHHFLKYRNASFSLLLEQEISQLINDWFSVVQKQPVSSTAVDLSEVNYAN
ncbi:MAG: MotA/TolQ/ExbB proton channel family protein [Gammaproteobacteria bacterium]|nr:MAG: MotA/TolQ/ExbB proton channel family protein [Gammaproteobacteria bacterium]